MSEKITRFATDETTGPAFKALEEEIKAANPDVAIDTIPHVGAIIGTVTEETKS